MMILRALKRQPLDGYPLAQQIKQTSSDLLEFEEGSLYPVPERPQKEEFAKACWAISSRNRRARIYQLTPRGAQHLDREVSRFERRREGITRV